MSASNFEYSVRNVPDSWIDAAGEAPKDDNPSTRRRPTSTTRRMPLGDRPDLLTGALTGTAMAVITGAAWYSLSVAGIYTGPWFAPLLGALIAIAVRLGAGPAGPEMRVGIGATLYIASLLVIALSIAREERTALSPRSPTFSEVEQVVTDRFLTQPIVMVAWVLGLAIMGWLTFALNRRRR